MSQSKGFDVLNPSTLAFWVVDFSVFCFVAVLVAVFAFFVVLGCRVDVLRTEGFFGSGADDADAALDAGSAGAGS